MLSTDPIADLLTRIRNAILVKQDRVNVPISKVKKSIVEILKSEGFIKNYKVIPDGKNEVMRLYLKYDSEKNNVIQGLKRISKPGRRVYANSKKTPVVISGLGIAIVSTSKGIITDKMCREFNVGGEVLCYIW